MFGVIYWENDSIVKPVLNKDGTLTVFNTIEESEKCAINLEASTGFAAHIISLEGVS